MLGYEPGPHSMRPNKRGCHLIVRVSNQNLWRQYHQLIIQNSLPFIQVSLFYLLPFPCDEVWKCINVQSKAGFSLNLQIDPSINGKTLAKSPGDFIQG